MRNQITCKKAVLYMLQKEEQPLSPWKRFMLYRHLGYCSLCRIFSGQNKAINETLKNKLPDGFLSTEEKQQIVEEALKRPADDH